MLIAVRIAIYCANEGWQPPSILEASGTRLEHFAIDSMHGADLGCFQDALGSLLWIEISARQWASNRATRIELLNQKLSAYYEANRDRGFSVVYLTKQQIIGKEPKYPYLKAKAAQTRHLAEFGLALAHLHRSGGSRSAFRFPASHPLHGRHQEHCDHLVSLFEGMVAYHRACAAAVFDMVECKRAMYQFLHGMKALNVMWRTGIPEDRHVYMPFHIRPKAHALQHLVEDKLHLWGSPRHFWCYRDEDYVGAMKVVAAASKDPRTIEKRVVEKISLVAGLNCAL